MRYRRAGFRTGRSGRVLGAGDFPKFCPLALVFINGDGVGKLCGANHLEYRRRRQCEASSGSWLALAYWLGVGKGLWNPCLMEKTKWGLLLNMASTVVAILSLLMMIASRNDERLEKLDARLRSVEQSNAMMRGQMQQQWSEE